MTEDYIMVVEWTSPTAQKVYERYEQAIADYCRLPAAPLPPEMTESWHKQKLQETEPLRRHMINLRACYTRVRMVRRTQEAPKDEPRHDYLSTACLHELHDRCRQKCKFCGEACRCECHKTQTVGVDEVL